METGVVVGGGGTRASQAPPTLFVGVAGVAVVAALLVVAFFPESSAKPTPPPGGQAVVGPDLQRWEALHNALTQVRVEAPAMVPGGHALTSLSHWRPRWSSSGASWSVVLHGRDGSWVSITIDPPALVAEVVDDVPRAEATVLEWEDSGYTMRVEGSGVPLTELSQVAAGLSLGERSQMSDGAPSVGYVPAGFGWHDGRAAAVGRGESGWQAGFANEAGGTVTITAAANGSFPFGDLFSLAADHQVLLRGYWGLAFDYPGAAPGAARSRVIWSEEGTMIEAASDHLSADQLSAAIEALDLRDPEAGVMRTSTARARLSWLGRRALATGTTGPDTAAELLTQLTGDR